MPVTSRTQDSISNMCVDPCLNDVHVFETMVPRELLSSELLVTNVVSVILLSFPITWTLSPPSDTLIMAL